MIKKGIFTSIWDGNTEITTPATLDTETGKITVAESVEVYVDVLEKEFFTDEEGIEYEVCPDCHEYVIKDVEFEHEGELGGRLCSCPYCESNIITEEINIITEETEVSFENKEQLSYKDYGNDNVELYVNGTLIGEIEVFTDRENGNREYICVNYEIVYLDTIENAS